AIPLAREILARGARFVSPRYPLVHVEEPRLSPLARRPNVLVLFLEALDRRFVGRTIAGRRVTPFLDAIVADSVSFEHFHANGAQTFHGLFASLCSSLPRQGTAATKARYANDYLCLPTLLTRGGYRTRMVIVQNRDRSHSRLGLFMARNGLEELIDEAAFPRSAPRYLDVGLERFFTGLRRDGALRDTVVLLLGDHGRHERVGRTDLENEAGHFTVPLAVWLDPSLRAPSIYRPRVVSGVASQLDL